jgi:hypothetical protein
VRSAVPRRVRSPQRRRSLWRRAASVARARLVHACSHAGRSSCTCAQQAKS